MEMAGYHPGLVSRRVRNKPIFDLVGFQQQHPVTLENPNGKPYGNNAKCLIADIAFAIEVKVSEFQHERQRKLYVKDLASLLNVNRLNPSCETCPGSGFMQVLIILPHTH